MYKLFLKRVLDLLFSLCLFVILSPFFLITFIMLLIIYKGNPFFYHERPGLNGDLFKVIKFKTMSDKKNKSIKYELDNVRRITPIGSILRKTSLDEIPQLLNVIKGDMSLVGPRPLLPEYLPIYNQIQKRRHDVKPGVTGWAQVNGRNAISWKKKFEYDVWYVENISFFLDLKILFSTFVKVIKKEDVNSSEEIIIERFNGEN